jgi:hypothetical protein
MLDARGGRQADAVLHIWYLDMAGEGCELETRSSRLIRRGSLRFVGEPSEDIPHYFGVSCRVPVHRLHPTKKIRWRVSIIYGNEEPGVRRSPKLRHVQLGPFALPQHPDASSEASGLPRS